MTTEHHLSWLALERFHLRELPPAEHDAAAAHLASCEACRRTLDEIASDDEARALAPLPPRAASSAKPSVAKVIPWYARPRVMAAATGLALAAALVLVLGRAPWSSSDSSDRDDPRVKGTSVSFALVREDAALVPEAGGPYRDGERFKALVTCPPGMKARFDLAVYERGAASFPLGEQTELACGNAVPLAGAFRVTGHERMTVCLVWSASSAAAIDRDALRRTSPELLAATPRVLCTNLDPAP